MADYELGTARGRIELDTSGVEYGIGRAQAATEGFKMSQEQASASVVRTGAIMTGGALAIGAGFAVAIKAASDFETRISAINAVSGATPDQLETVRKKALQLGADTKFSASEAAQAMEELVKAGISIPDVLNGAADATVALAAAGEIELPQAATIAANAMNAFSLSAQDMPHVADLIAGAANASAIDINEFAMSLQQSGAVAALSGLSFDDLTLSIAAMGNAGIKGSDAGTSLKTFLQNLIPVTDKQITLSKELGLVTEDGANAFFDASGKIKSMAEISDVLAGALQGMGEEQKLLTLQTLFGSDAIRAAAIIADTGSQGFNNLADAVGKVSAQDVAAKRMDNLSGSIEQLKGSVETLLIIVGRPLADSLRNVVDWLTQAINWIGALDPKTIGLVSTIGKLVGGFLAIAGVGLILLGIMHKSSQAFGALSAVLAASPVMATVIAIAALAYAFYQAYQNIKPFREFVDGLVSSIRDFLQPTIDNIKLAIENFVKGFQNPDEKFLGYMSDVVGIGQNVRTTLDSLVGGFQSFVEWADRSLAPIGGLRTVLIGVGAALGVIALAITSPITLLAALVTGLIYAYGNFESFRNVVNTLGAAIVAVGLWFAWLGREIVERLGGGFEWLQTNVFPTLNSFADLVGAIVGRIIEFWGRLSPYIQAGLTGVIAVIQAFLGTAQRVIEFFTRTVGVIWDNFAGHIWSTVEIAFGVLKQIVESALRVVQGIIQVITGVISGDWGKAWDGIKNIFGAVWDLIKYLPGAALDFIMVSIAQFFDALNAAWQIGLDAIQSIIENALEVTKRLFTGAWDIIKKVVPEMVSAFIDAFGSLPGHLASVGQAIASWFIGLPGNIVGWIGDNKNTLLDVGKNIIGGLLFGLKLAFVAVVGWFITLPVLTLAALARAAFWLIPKGKDLIVGLLTGIISAVPQVINWFINLPGNIIGWIGDVATTLGPKAWDLLWGFLVALGQAELAVFDWFVKLPGRIISWIGDVLPTLASKGWDLVTGLWNGLHDFEWMIIGWFQDLPGNIVGWVGDVTRTLVDKAAELLGSIKTGLEENVGTVTEWFKGLPQKIKDGVVDAAYWLIGMGGDIISGLISGFESAWSAIVDWVKTKATDLIHYFTHPWELLSPSHVTQRLGQGIMAGYLLGLKNGYRTLERYVASMAPQMQAQLSVVGTGMSVTSPMTPTGAGINQYVNPAITFSFPNVGSARDAEAVKAALSDTSVVTELRRSIRVGVGRR